MPKPTIQSYEDCRNFIAGGRKNTRYLSGNVAVEKHEDCYNVFVWATNVCTYYPDGSFKINTSGWRTNMTMRWINALSPVSVFTERGIMWLQWQGIVYYYQDNAIFRPDGSVEGLSYTQEEFLAQWKADKKDRRNKRKQIKKYAVHYATLVSELVKKPIKRKMEFSRKELWHFIENHKFHPLMLQQMAEKWGITLDVNAYPEKQTMLCNVILAMFGKADKSYLKFLPTVKFQLQSAVAASVEWYCLSRLDLQSSFDSYCYNFWESL